MVEVEYVLQGNDKCSVVRVLETVLLHSTHCQLVPNGGKSAYRSMSKLMTLDSTSHALTATCSFPSLDVGKHYKKVVERRLLFLRWRILSTFFEGKNCV